jgi:hypothetical protein
VNICAHIDPAPGHDKARYCHCGQYAFVTVNRCLTHGVPNGMHAAWDNFAVRRRTEDNRPLG